VIFSYCLFLKFYSS